MNSLDGENGISSQGTTTPAFGTPASKDSLVSNHGDNVKMMNSTPNGYSSVPNHKTKSDGSHHKKPDGMKNHSSHSKKKDGESPKNKDKHSSSSKSKDGTKIQLDKSIESMKSKEHSHKEKKHHGSPVKTKDESGKHSDHLKLSNNIKKEAEKIKSSEKIKKEHKSVEEKHKTDNVKDSKSKDEKEKEKHRDKCKEMKDKTFEGHKDKLNDKPKDKMKVKHKEVSPDKSDFKDKMKVKHKEVSPDKSVFKDNKKGVADDIKHSSIKIKLEHSPVKIKVEHTPVKIKVEHTPVKTKVVHPANMKVEEQSLSEDDVPLSDRKSAKESKPKGMKRIKSAGEACDDETLSSRAQKVKKANADSTTHKRKADEDEDYDARKPVKKIKKEKEIRKTKETETSSPRKKGKQKEEEQDVWKWWEEEKHAEGVKWRTLEHHGPVFAPLYERVPDKVKFLYNGKHMKLSELTEEVAGFYGRMLDHEYTTKDVFNKNFFKDWRKVMTPSEKETITDLSKCNFKDFDEYYKLKSEERKNMTKAEKQAIKIENEELTKKYGFCVIDGHRQKIGNFRIEPPGLFRGRGEHPKMGMLKRRVQSEDIIINLGKSATVPKPPEGHKWKEVRHDNTVTWLASWTENILGSTKYIMLNPSSKLKGEKDWQKYETARKLKNFADSIRNTYTNDFKSKEMKVRQRAVALYFIDKLALRAGNEKDEETADTVGCCSLRVEHITLDEEKDGQEFVVSFDFLGKDSIRYVNSVAVEKRAFKNLKLFMENKQPGDDLFDRLNTGILNKYLNELMDGLTAKVFRTYNASKTLQEQLDVLTKEEMSLPEKILAYNRANRAVAVLCNHQRSVPKGFSKSMENLKNKMDEKIQQIKDFKKEFKQSKQAKDKIGNDKKKKRLQQLEEQLKKLEVQATDKEENKQIALGTSKLNYLDPRISVAWCKKWDVPIDKIYNRTQRDKFRWAIEMAGPDFKF